MCLEKVEARHLGKAEARHFENLGSGYLGKVRASASGKSRGDCKSYFHVNSIFSVTLPAIKLHLDKSIMEFHYYVMYRLSSETGSHFFYYALLGSFLFME